MTGISRHLCAVLLALTAAVSTASDAVADPVVFAAASLKDGLDAVIEAWASEGDNSATVSYGGSGTLARQIELGAPADIFISANIEWMDYLEAAALVESSSRFDLLGNEIVLIAPSDEVPNLTIGPEFALREALGDGRLAVANVDAVPAGIYAKAALQSLGVWDDVEDRLAEAENVRAAMAYVARGEVPLGIVYATDVIVEPRVTVVGVFPPTSHSPIVYPVALTADTSESSVESLVAFLKSPQAAAIFRRFGFAVPEG